MKFTAAVTRRCNMSCRYCYVSRNGREMSEDTAERTVDFAASLVSPNGDLDFGFFGGEPLLSLDLIEMMTARLRERQTDQGFSLATGLTTNGVLLSSQVTERLATADMNVCVSLDGDYDTYRSNRMIDANRYDAIIENTMRAADTLPGLRLNAVYGPKTVHRLPETVRYLLGFGLPIELNIDIIADWQERDLENVDEVFGEVGALYLARHLADEPIPIQPLEDHILTAILGGADPHCRCRMGSEELAADTDGVLYPCERLIDYSTLTIGDIDTGIDTSLQERAIAEHQTYHPACLECTVQQFCNHTCGCTNRIMTGRYGVTHRAVCRIEKALIGTVRDILDPLRTSPGFSRYMIDLMNRHCKPCKEKRGTG